MLEHAIQGEISKNRTLRIKLKQKQAHYGRPECVDNRMTYPLPPFSTVIGAIHNACGFSQYQDMKISIQGNYQSMQKEIFMYQSLNNRREDDRGNLVYLQNPAMLSSGYITVAKALKNQGNSFKNNITIDIVDYSMMTKYWDLLRKSDDFKVMSEELKEKNKIFKEKEKQKKQELKNLDKKSPEYKEIQDEIKIEKQKLKDLEDEYKWKKELEYDQPISHYKTLIKGPRYVEVLYGVELVIHVNSSKEVIDKIIACKNRLISLGRSEDFVELIEMKEVDLFTEIPQETLEEEGCLYSGNNAAYITKSALQSNVVFVGVGRDAVRKIPVRGTTYYLPKNYNIVEGKREFEYVPMCYLSNFFVESDSFFRNGDSTGIFLDDENFIVNLV